MIGRRSLLGLLAGLPFVGQAVAKTVTEEPPRFAQGGLVRGPGIYANSGDPLLQAGEIGDVYINVSNRETFQRTRDGWLFVGRI